MRVSSHAAWATLLVLLTYAGPVGAQHILLPGDDIAVDQPRILFGLEDPANPGEIFGPPFFNDGLLDTGANGLLLAQLAYYDPNTGSVDPDYYPLAQRSDGSFIQYEELGVAGTAFFDMLEPFDLNFAGNDLVTHVIPNTRIMGAPALNAGSFAAILGMPVMQGRVVQLNLRPVAQIDFMEVQFISARPAPTPTSYSVNLSMLPAEFPGQQEPTDPLPTYADLPLVNISTSDDGLATGSSMLLDTGAQTSIISQDAALAMGLVLDANDPNTDVIGFIEVGGIGGTVDMPMVEIDQLVMPTNEGVDLVFSNLQVGVLDIPGLGGVLGMNILTSGYSDILFGGSNEAYGAFGDIFLDFTNPTGLLRFDVNPAFHNVVVPEPTSVACIAVAAALGLLRRRTRMASVAL